MPRVIGIHDESAAQDAIREAVACLQSGGTVGFPGSTSYCAAALVSHADAVSALFREGSDCWLALAGSDQATDIAPELPALARRLIRRCWPGPLVVQASAEGGAIQSLPLTVQAVLKRSEHVELIVPDAPLLETALGLLPAPLAISTDNEPVPAADDLVAAYPALDLVLDSGPPMYEARASAVRPTQTGFELLFAGILSEQAIRVSACQIYLFVCTGNTCRSPLAEGLFRILLAERLHCGVDDLVDRGFLIQSAGLAAGSAASASFESIELLKRRGIDLSNHASQPVSEQLLSVSDHIFTMTNGHRDAIVRFRPDLADRVEVLRRDGRDVVDPIGGGIGEYERCEREIEESLREIILSHVREEA